MDIVKLGIEVDSRKVKDATRDLDRLGKEGGRAEKSISNLGKAFGAVGAIGAAAAIRKVIAATKESEQAVAQLEAGLASTGNAAGKSVEELTKKAQELQRVTTLGDEEIIRSQAVLLSFTNVVGQEFDKTIELAADLSTRMGIDLKSSVTQLGKAMNDPILGLSMLSRSGIQFSDSQKEMIKSLVESNRLLDAQAIILKEVETQFGGSARAARDTFGGALDGLGNAFDDLFEASSGLDDAKDSVEKLTALLQDPDTIKGANRIASGIVDISAALIGVAAEVPGFLDFIRNVSVAKIFGAGATGDIVLISDALAEAKEELRELEKIDLSSMFVFRKDMIRDLIGQTETEIKQLQSQYDKLLTPPSWPNSDKTTSTSGAPPKLPKPPEPPTRPTGPSQFETLEADLQRQIALYGEVGEAAKLRYAVENNEIKGLKAGQGELLISLGAKLDSLEDEAKALDEAAEAQDRLRESQEAYKEEIDALVESSMPELDRELKSIREDMLMLTLALDEFPEKADQINAAIGRIAQREKELIEGVKESTDEISVFAEQAARNIQDSLGNAINDLILGTEDWEKTFLKALLNIVSQAAAADLAASLGLPGAGKGGNLAGLVKAGMSFLPGFADGGRPDPRKISVVGERGPELFVPDGVKGTVLPNGQMPQQQVNVNAVTVLDANSIASVMSSPEMGQTFINQARINRSEFRAALGITQ